MADMSIFRVAQQHARWLIDRQNAIAENVAHAASPGFRASDVGTFAASVGAADISMTSTDERHLQNGTESGQAFRRVALKGDATSHSGNNVSLDQQLLMSNEVHQGYALNAGIVKSFHRMILSAAKS
ncbi:MAG: flagellar basal body rod protein FlgB [Rhodoblastus sp.]